MESFLLTHIGFYEDKKLAEELGQDCDVDIIIGGHSHTYLEEPCVVAGIPIVQAAVGTEQIGRFDILFDEHKKDIESYTWELIPITDERCPHDPDSREIIKLSIDGRDVKNDEVYSMAIQSYFLFGIQDFLGISIEEIQQNGEPEELASGCPKRDQGVSGKSRLH